MAQLKFDHTTFFNGYRDEYGRLTQEQVDGLESLLTAIEGDATISDIRWAAYMLATVKHECADRWQPITEYGSVSYFDKYDAGTELGRQLGNTQPGDGYNYRGRGYVQLTGRTNYAKMDTELNLGTTLIDTPDKALDPGIAYQVMSVGMQNGFFTGRKLSDYISGSRCDYDNARRIINGLDQYQLIAGYAVQLERILNQAQAG